MVLKDSMFSIRSEEALTTHIELHADHPIYQAHFPGTPITPGVCIVQMIGELAERQVGHSLILCKIANLKFLAPVSPTSNPVIDIIFTSIDQEDSDVKTKGTIMADDKPMTKFSVVFRKR